jgi:hypothetical protein
MSVLLRLLAAIVVGLTASWWIAHFIVWAHIICTRSKEDLRYIVGDA